MRQIIKQKRIDGLYHFTPAKNLETIFPQPGNLKPGFPYGLVPRKTLSQYNYGKEAKDWVDYGYTDKQRMDNHRDTVSTSIGFPNYKMFKRKRDDMIATDWAVLRLDTDIMCDFKCAYFDTNAANHKYSDKPIKPKMRKEAFEELFSSPEATYPKDEQAEVMVFGTIPIHYILNVYFEDAETLQKYRKFIPPDIPADVKKRVFMNVKYENTKEQK